MEECTTSNKEYMDCYSSSNNKIPLTLKAVGSRIKQGSTNSTMPAMITINNITYYPGQNILLTITKLQPPIMQLLSQNKCYYSSLNEIQSLAILSVTSKTLS
jgi:hypothetical protein